MPRAIPYIGTHFDLYAAMVGSPDFDSLYGASDDSQAAYVDYWLQLKLDREPFQIVSLEKVPRELAEKLLAQGLRDQAFSDGYQAAKAAEPYDQGWLEEFTVEDMREEDEAPPEEPVHVLGPRERSVDRRRRTDEPEEFLRDAVDVDGEGDPAVHHDREPHFPSRLVHRPLLRAEEYASGAGR